MQMSYFILVAMVLLSIIVAGCFEQPPLKTPPNLNPDSNVTALINAEWNKAYGTGGVSVINSSARIYGYQMNKIEVVSFNTTDGNTHMAEILFNNTKGAPGYYTNESPNMLDMNGWPAAYYNITIS
jgi:hypothetical protein